MLMACYVLNRVPNKGNKTSPYELGFKKAPNLSYPSNLGLLGGCKITRAEKDYYMRKREELIVLSLDKLKILKHIGYLS